MNATNDEDFARRAFTAAFRSGPTGEPPILPDVESLVSRGRRASRQRHGVYAAGTTALAGVVTAGVVTAPTLLGIGSPSSSVAAGAGGTTAPPAASSSTSAPDRAPSSPGVRCATPPAIDWASVLSAALPAGVTATADKSANCVELADGTRSIDALFTLSTGNVGLQVTVGTGPQIARKLTGGGSPGSTTSPDPATESKLGAAKRAAAGLPSGSDTSAATTSPNASKIEPAKSTGTCAGVGPNEHTCVTHLTKDSISVVDAQILRIGTNAVVVDVVASNGKGLSTPAPEQLPSDATMVAIAEAVAAHF
jgi:hypothetical protein